VKSGQLNSVASGLVSSAAAGAASIAPIAQQEVATDMKFCAIDNPDCEACQ
jgi:ribonucleoside-diphosphate reductase alpha chain